MLARMASKALSFVVDGEKPRRPANITVVPFVFCSFCGSLIILLDWLAARKV